jgi:hypothetical protein
VTTHDYDLLVEAGVLSNIELIAGEIVMGEYEFVFGPEQAADAARLGIRDLRTCVDAVLDDPELRAEVRARLGA